MAATAGGVAEALHRVFNAPQAVLVFAAILLALLLVGLIAIAWWQREELLAWFTIRSRRRLLAAGSVGFLLVAGFGWLGLRSWHYVERDNAFCNGCHVMVPAWQKLQASQHAKLSCHQCHQQSIFASTSGWRSARTGSHRTRRCRTSAASCATSRATPRGGNRSKPPKGTGSTWSRHGSRRSSACAATASACTSSCPPAGHAVRPAATRPSASG